VVARALRIAVGNRAFLIGLCVSNRRVSSGRHLARTPFLLRNGNEGRHAAAKPPIACGRVALRPRNGRGKTPKSADIPTFGALTAGLGESQAMYTWPGKTGDDIAAAKPVR
jgi:hypothetical protein